MKLLYVTQYFSTEPTHASTVTTYEIVRRLAQRGHVVTVVSADCPGTARIFREKANNLQIINSLPIPPLTTQWYDGFTTLFTHTIAHVPLIANALLLNQNRTDEKFDAVISMYHPTHLATVSAHLLCRILKIPLVVKIYDFIVETIEPQKLKRLYHLALGKINVEVLKRGDSPILVQSPELRDVIKREGRIEDRRLVVFPNGVDTKLFKPGIKCDELRKRLGLENKTVVLFLGGLYRQRHPELLIKALPQIIKEMKDLVMLFVGEGPEQPKLISLAERLGVSDFVKFVDSVEHSSVPELISLADVTIGPLSTTSYPTIYGSTPLTVLEYMACEKPVIVCRGAVSESIIVDGYTGVRVEPGNINGLSSAIFKVIRDKSFSQSIARNARSYIEKMCSWDVLIMKLEEVLNSIV